MEDIIGKNFGYLTPLKETGFIYSGKDTAKRKFKKRLYECVCVCGKLVTLRRNEIVSGNTRSCGCKSNELNAKIKFKDFTGHIFSRLKVVQYVKKIGEHHLWLCRCDCGNILEVRASNLVTGTTKSCGCLFKESVTKHGLSGNASEYRKYRWDKNPTLKLQHQVSNAVRKAIKSKNGRTFDFLPYTAEELRLHLESLWESWMNWDNYGKEWHIDHIKPQASFDIKSMQDVEFLECWGLSNLRPLEKIENMKKGSKIQ